MNHHTEPEPRRIELDVELIADLDVPDDESANLRGGLSKSCAITSIPTATNTCTCFSTIY